MVNRRSIVIGLVAVSAAARGINNLNNDESVVESSDSTSNTEATGDTDEDQERDYDPPAEELPDEEEEPPNVEDEIEEDLDDTESIDTTTTIINQGQRLVRAGEYIYWKFEVNNSAEQIILETTVRIGPRIDIFIIDPNEFRQFTEGNRFRYYEKVSQMNTIGDTTRGTTSTGEFYLVVDNTTAGEAIPSNQEDARVDIKLTLST